MQDYPGKIYNFVTETRGKGTAPEKVTIFLTLKTKKYDL